jgi:3-phenylpropionate/trans-cinnamate dioxygenase ferredoxin reductase subunit
MTHPIVIVGAGQAAASFIAKLRGGDYSGAIILIGDESTLPYQRPPLSKKYLLGEMQLDRLLLRPQSWYDDNQVTLKLNSTAKAIDKNAKQISLIDGETIHYSKLLLATGSTPHWLPETMGGRLSSVYTLRNLRDVEQMKAEFQAGRKLLIIGGGYIGLEAAAVAAGLGLEVTVIELADRILKRVASPATSDYFRATHRANGVTILENTGLEALVEKDGKVVAAKLNDGTELLVDFAITGIGVAPNVQLAKDADLTIDNGIATNLQSQTSDANIYSAGDCASFEYKGQRIRLESVQNAVDQAENASLHILGEDVSYKPIPWFWSDQFKTKLQIAGLNLGYTDTVIRQGKREGSQSVWYFNEDKFLAVDAMNDPIAYTMGRKILAAGNHPEKSQVADTAVNLKDFT